MVTYTQIFAERLKAFTDNYTVIGGTACDILLSEAGLKFRSTKDIDMILLLEENAVEFGKAFWDFITEGEYTFGEKKDEKTCFYRFTTEKPGYPSMIELFSRKPDFVLSPPGSKTPVPIGEDISSLSAVILDDDFYSFMCEGKITKGISILRPEYLIPFKMYAWVNLMNEKAFGKFVADGNLKKHRNDVYRLLQIVNTDTRVTTQGNVKKAIQDFLALSAENPMDSNHGKQLNLLYDYRDAEKIIQSIYL